MAQEGTAMEVPCINDHHNNSHSQLLQIEAVRPPRTYKASRFNAHTIAPDGTLVLYNSFTGHRCGIPPHLAETATRHLSQVGILGPLDKVGEYLRKKGYIVDESIDENARHDVRYSRYQFRTDMLELILLPSEECNFRCVYCSQEFKRDNMLPEVREGVRNLVLQRISKLKGLNISWFGGEPMLGYDDVIADLAPFFKRITAEHDVHYFSSMTTNGYLVTPERAAKMLEWGIRHYQITVDGTAGDHDQHRPLADGGPTFQVIMNNLIALKENPESFKVTVRVNFDQTNVRRFGPLFEHLHESLKGDSRFEMDFHPVGKWGGPNDDDLEICGFKEVGRLHKELRQEARSHGLGTMKVSQMLEPDPGSVCYAARPYNFIVGTDGKLMKCTQVLDTLDSNVIGRICRDGELEIESDLLNGWVQPYYHSDTMCNKCFFVPVCQGAVCPLVRVRDNVRPCPPYKTEIASTLLDLWEEESRLAPRLTPANADSNVPLESTYEAGTLSPAST